MLEFIKNSLRISGNDFDNEILSLIKSAKQDLISSGVTQSCLADTNNYLVKNAIMNYCKSEFGYDNPDSDKFKKAYDVMKTKLAIICNKGK